MSTIHRGLCLEVCGGGGGGLGIVEKHSRGEWRIKLTDIVFQTKYSIKNLIGLLSETDAEGTSN